MSIFAHIVSTEYSNEEAFGKIDMKKNKEFIKMWADIAQEAGEENPCLILADRFSTAAQIPFFKACLEYGVKPVFGLKATIKGKDGSENHEVVLIAKNDVGRQNINRITTEAYKVTVDKEYKMILREDLEKYKDGLICISGGVNGLVEKNIVEGDIETAKKVAMYFSKIFNNNFYLQVKRTSNDVEGQEIEEKIIKGVKQISLDTGIKYVANNDVRFAKKEYYKLFITKKAIIRGDLIYDPSKSHIETDNQYLKPTAQILDIFKDMPEAVFNMGGLVDSTDISDFSSRLGKSHLPKFPIPEDFNDDPSLYLTHVTEVGFEKRWLKIEEDYRKVLNTKDKKNNVIDEGYIKSQKEMYKDRIYFEIETIKNTGFPGYFLIVHELVSWCKENDIPVGPGRGSGAGSLVLYALGITDVDPIPFDLLFERFLNPERMSEPDIDIDFSPKNRDRVIQHMKELYGSDNTAQILTEGTLAAKSVIDSIGRVRGLQPYERDKIKSMIPDTPGTSLKMEMESNEKLIEYYNTSRQGKAILQDAIHLEGSVVSYGKHAGGVVISLGDMAQYASLYREEGTNAPVVNMNKDLCEIAGLIKFDLLGLKNLDVIQECVREINKGLPLEKQLNIDNILLNDPLTLNLFKNADTYGIFQFESVGIRRLLKDVSPDVFDELVALVALYRPGPLLSGMDKDFIERKFNPSKIEYLHPRLKETLEPTFGTIIYQEQVMRIARELAGFTLGQSDILRKAMGKKDAEIMLQQREAFISGCNNEFREETLKSTTERLKSPVNPEIKIAADIVFENTKSEVIKSIVAETDFKFTKLEQVNKILMDYAGLSKDEIDSFKLEVDNMEDKVFFNKYFSKIILNGKDKLIAEGLSENDAVSTLGSVAVASSIFVRFNKIFALMDKFAGYGFNKSHSVAYALISFQTGYLKAHYPAQYMASMLSNESNLESVTTTLIEARRMGLKVLTPDINLSVEYFKALTPSSGEKSIVYGLSQVKAINKAVSYIVKIREEKGDVKDIFDFYDKFGTYKIKESTEQLDGTIKTSNKTLIGKAVLNNLLNAGVLDSICPDKDPVHRPMLQATYNYLTEVVVDMNKRFKFNYNDITKKLGFIMSTKEVNIYLKEVTEMENYKELFMPDIVSEFDSERLLKIYTQIENKVLENSKKSTQNLSLKKISDYHKELETFNTDIKKMRVMQDGKVLTYILPTSVNYDSVPEYGSKESAFLEHNLTGMYQTINPLKTGDIQDILKSKNYNCSSSKDLAQQVETFGQLSRNGKRYYDTYFAGVIIELNDFKRTNHDTGESYININAVVDDGNGVVSVIFKDDLFAAGKEERGLDMLKEMVKKEIIIFKGSASNSSYESGGVTIYAKKIGSTNPDLYLPMDEPDLNFLSNEMEGIMKEIKSEDLATPAQIGKLASLLKRSNSSFTEIFNEFKVSELNELKKHEASKLIQKHSENKMSP